MSGLNDDHTSLVVVDGATERWLEAPTPGVWRKRLFHRGDPENGVVTSLVRYDRGRSFPGHGHPAGEEILVLQGTFSDAGGDYSEGSYLLNPPGYRHTPTSTPGCVLFVKLRQYAGEGRQKIRINYKSAEWAPTAADGVEGLSLYEQRGFPEKIRLMRFAAKSVLQAETYANGCEVFVIAGPLEVDGQSYRTGTWLRWPAGASPVFGSGRGATIYHCTS